MIESMLFKNLNGSVVMGKRVRQLNPILEIGAGFAVATTGRFAGKRVHRTRFEPYAKEPVEELRLVAVPEGAIKDGVDFVRVWFRV